MFLGNENNFFLLCFVSNIVSAIQLNVPLKPLPNQGLLKKRFCFFIEEKQRSCSSCELLEATDYIFLPRL